MIYICKDKNMPDKSLVGGKGYNLTHLYNNNFNVPEFIVLTTEFFCKKLHGVSSEIESILNYDNIKQTHKDVTSFLDKALTFTKEEEDSLISSMLTIFDKNELLAVRSSSVDEDSSKLSFAGQMDSFLNVTMDNITDVIKKCFISSYSERALFYRKTNGLDLSLISSAVIVQKMVKPSLSGVMFTTNPLTNNPDEILINVVEGFGEKLVSGETDSSIYIVNTDNDILYKKELRGTNVSDEIVLNLKEIAIKIEESYDPRLAQDIEFSIVGREIVVLQSRPITTYFNIYKSNSRIVFDNSNIGESYPGVTTPLSFSFAKMIYRDVYKSVCNKVNKNKDLLLEFDDVFANMVSFYDGRLYYNLNNWYKCLQLAPGYNINRGFMEQMMGVKSSMNIDYVMQKSNVIKEIYYLTQSVATIFNYYFTIKSKTNSFLKNFDLYTKKYKSVDFSSFTEKELYSIYSNLTGNILSNWVTPIANDTFTMIFTGLLNNEVKSIDKDNYETIVNDLLMGQDDIYSLKPIKELYKLADYVKNNEYILNIVNNDDFDLLLSDDDNVKEFKKLALDYIQDYGARTMNEQKLECPTMNQDKSLFFTQLKNYVNMPESNRLSESEDKNDLSKKASNTNILKRLYINFLCKKAKYFVKNRELLRFKRTQIFGIMKELFSALGDIYKKEGILDSSQDIYFLTLDEIFNDIAKRKFNQTELKQELEIRKNKYKENILTPTKERIYFYNEIKPENALVTLSIDETLRNDSDIDLGIPCVQGIVKGTVQLVSDGKIDNIYGDILVVERIDPGYIPYFTMFKGIVVERGSVLSHASVVARELNIPTIVGYRGITSRLKDKQVIEMNGNDGTIKIIE